MNVTGRFRRTALEARKMSKWVDDVEQIPSEMEEKHVEILQGKVRGCRQSQEV